MKTLAKKLMALVLCLAMALGLLGVTSAGAVQSAPKAEESASKVIYATDSKTTYVPAGYTYVYQSTDGRIYTRKATQDTYISGRTLSATEAKALASLSYGAESTITTDDGQTLVCREYDAKEAAAYSDAVKAILSGEDYSNGDKVTVVSEAHEKNDKVKVIISLEAPAVCEMDGMSVELGKGLGKAELAAVQSVKNGQSSVLSAAKKKLGHSIEVTGQFSLVTNAIARHGFLWRYGNAQQAAGRQEGLPFPVLLRAGDQCRGDGRLSDQHEHEVRGRRYGRERRMGRGL